MFISEISGHREASRAVETALHKIDPDVETLAINAFSYTNPILEKVVNQAYMGVVKNIPQLWDYLYDNTKFVKRTQKLKDSINKSNSDKLRGLFERFKPDCVVCTQAYPCGLAAYYKKRRKNELSIVGVLTDYAPHSYWVYDNVNAYIVPSEQTGHELIEHGVSKDRIKPFGVPISPRFCKNSDTTETLKKLRFKKAVPIILIMGGGQGLGPIKNVVNALDKVTRELQVVVVCGSNRRLYNYLRKKEKKFRKNIRVFPFVNNMDELMAVSTLIVTKPGGLTAAEALSRKLPIIIIDPLPGQEALNTNFLLSKELAIKVSGTEELITEVEKLICDSARLNNMRSSALKHSKPDAALKTAELVLDLI